MDASSISKWKGIAVGSNLHRLTTLGRQAAFELYDRGDIFGFDAGGCLRLMKRDPEEKGAI